MAQIQPPTHTLDPKLFNFYKKMFTFMYYNLWVTSDVQFRKGASIPPFRVEFGWADWGLQGLQKKAFSQEKRLQACS
jgi:hypothetical protein